MANHVTNALQVIVKAPVTHKGGFSSKPPTVMLHLSKEFVVGGDGPSRKHPDSLESTPHGNAGRLVSLEFTNEFEFEFQVEFEFECCTNHLHPVASGLPCV